MYPSILYPVCLSIHSVGLSIHPSIPTITSINSICPSILFVCLSIHSIYTLYLSIHSISSLSIHLVYISIYPSIQPSGLSILSVHPFYIQSVYPSSLCIHLSIHPSIHLSNNAVYQFYLSIHSVCISIYSIYPVHSIYPSILSLFPIHLSIYSISCLSLTQPRYLPIHPFIQSVSLSIHSMYLSSYPSNLFLCLACV